MFQLRCFVSFLVLLIVCAAADGHHSFGTFDLNLSVELTGTIEGVEFVNPHAWLQLSVAGPDGAQTRYRCEMRGATVLRRSGWTPEMFVRGAPIIVQGAPDRVDPHACYVNTVTFADGTSLDRYSQRRQAGQSAASDDRSESLNENVRAGPPRLPNGVPDISGSWAVEQLVMTDPRGRRGALVPVSVAAESRQGGVGNSLAMPGTEGTNALSFAYGVYRLAIGAVSVDALPWRDAPVVFTDRGRAARLRGGERPHMNCMPTSIIFDWYDDLPVNRITQSGQKISIETGHYGLVRTVHLDVDQHPDDLEPTLSGHSIGRWEDDVLVVDTIGFAAGMLGEETPHGPDLHVVERFSINSEGTALTREYIAEDPAYFVGEYSGVDISPRSESQFFPETCDVSPYIADDEGEE